MAGATIRVKFDDDEVAEVLNRLLAKGRDMTPLMRDIGERLLNTTRKRFEDEEVPDGTPWAPLTEATKKRKRRNVDTVLTESGAFRGHGLRFQARRDQVEIGSPLIYPGTHQFGAARGAFGSTSGGEPIPWGDIPAREVFGVSDDDEDEIRALVNRYIGERSR